MVSLVLVLILHDSFSITTAIGSVAFAIAGIAVTSALSCAGIVATVPVSISVGIGTSSVIMTSN